MKDRHEQRQFGIHKNLISQSRCTWPTVEKTLGLKLCTDYHFTNITDRKLLPHFVLSGPAGVRLSLQKTDPKVKSYVLDITWKPKENGNVIKLTFDTPGATISRLLSANLTNDNDSGNTTLLLKSSDVVVQGRGKYKNTAAVKYLELGLDINGKKNFDVLLSLTRDDIKYGHIYNPRFYLGINEERVAELQGM